MMRKCNKGQLMLKKFLFALILCLAWISNAEALNFTKKTDHVSLNLTPEYQTLSPDTKTLTVIAEINIAPNWHIYWDNPGDTGDPTTLIFYDSPYYTKTKATHTAPKKSVFNELITTYIYRQKLYHKITFDLNNLNQESNLSFTAVLTYTVCREECLPETIKINMNLPVKAEIEKNPSYLDKLLKAESTFPLPLETSFKLKNESFLLSISESIIKACKEPEFISIYPKKSILSDLPKTSITKSGKLKVTFDEGETPKDISGVLLCSRHSYYITPKLSANVPPAPVAPKGFFYYILTAFLAGLILNLMPCVLPILSLKALYLTAHKEKASVLSALVYLSGVLASFLVLSGILYGLRGYGTELGWGFQLQSPAFNIFLMLLFFLIFLNLTDKLQIPDKFADKLSKLAGNKSFLTGFFAVIIACPCTGPFMGAALGYAMNEPPLTYFAIFLSLGFGYALPYVLIEAFPAFFLKFIPKPGHWMITLKHILAIPIALTCLWLLWITAHQLRPHPHAKDILWETYNPQKVEQALDNNEAVFIDFTAKWCLVCLLNDKTALATETFENLAKEKHIRLYKADWTNHNKEIADALKSYGRNSIPLYIYYKKGATEPTYLPQILTTDILKETLN